MKKLILAVAVMGAFAGVANAQEAATPEHTFTGNLTVATDYRFRGISQTFKQPTVQGGFDYAHSSGFYVGNWNSNVSGNSYTDGSIEMDLYAGYKFAITPDFTADVGALYYYYPGAQVTGGEKYDTTELYVAGTYKWFTAKYSYAISDAFGVANSDGSDYLELNANFEVADKTTLGLHIGKTTVKNNSASDYQDYKISLSRDFGFATIGLAVVATDIDGDLLTTAPSGKSKKLGDTSAVLSISKAF
ncbi:TorF family putative porin [Herminiimonas aquatilis]|uniref:TorF family putative porin n=1 Tax=Herminiimonas aquatilis TaxID=345342 RepID=A0ABW2J3D0_9BURK